MKTEFGIVSNPYFFFLLCQTMVTACSLTSLTLSLARNLVIVVCFGWVADPWTCDGGGGNGVQQGYSLVQPHPAT